MIYKISVKSLPDVTRVYSVQRRTVWQIADPDTLLIFAADGRCQITIDNTKYVLTKGSILLIPAKQHYVRRPIDNEMCTLYYAHIRLHDKITELTDREAVELINSRISAHSRELFMREDTDSNEKHRYLISALTDVSDRCDEITALWKEMTDAMISHRSNSATVCSLAVVRILLIMALREDYFADYTMPAGDDGNYLRLRRIISYIHLHAKETITLDDLCAECNFSKQHLIRVFKAEFGQTPKAYILEHKINVAKELFFRNPYISVKEVADEMGFEDQSYFSRLFVKVSGISPTDYKKHLLTFDPSKQ